MVSKVLIALCLVVAVVAAVPAASPPWGGGGVNPWVPQWLATAPWWPQWIPCTTVGPSCLDCNTRVACTKMMYGLKKACDDPTMPHCNLGECSATPSDQCAVVAVPANAV